MSNPDKRKAMQANDFFARKRRSKQAWMRMEILKAQQQIPLFGSDYKKPDKKSYGKQRHVQGGRNHHTAQTTTFADISAGFDDESIRNRRKIAGLK